MKRLIFLAIATQLVGCASLLNPPPARDPAFAPARPESMVVAPQNIGSIYQPNGDMRLFEDVKAKRVGDILTVRLIETTDASKTADTKASRVGTTTVEVPTIMGVAVSGLKESLSSSNSMEGKGTSDQSNKLTGKVSVSVVEVLPNGYLRVQGEKRVALNQGNEYIKLSGIVRPMDIDTSNSVDSTKVADATMIYNGDGVMSDVNRMGWLQRLFTSVVFPY